MIICKRSSSKLSCMLVNLIATGQDVVAFGITMFLNDTSIQFYINSLHNDTVPICHLYGCMTCNQSLGVDNNKTLLIEDRIIFSVRSEQLTVTAQFSNTQSPSTDYTLLLMLDPQAEHSFVYYAASVNFMDAQLQSNHNNILHIMAFTDNTEVRIAPSRDVTINGRMVLYGEEYIILILNIGETVTVVSSEDLTGSRVTTNKATSFYSGQICTSAQSSNCSMLIQQIPPYNSWGNSFIVHTNISSRDGFSDKFKIVASDMGADVLFTCTNDGTVYDHNNFTLDFRQHSVLATDYKYCIITSNEKILLLQFQDGNDNLVGTFSTVIPAEIQYTDYYVFNAFENFTSIAALTVKSEHLIIAPLLLDDFLVEVNWKQIEFGEYVFSYTTLTLDTGRHTLTFSGTSIKFGAVLYGFNKTDVYGLPAGIELDQTTSFPFQGVVNHNYAISYILLLFSSFNSPGSFHYTR